MGVVGYYGPHVQTTTHTPSGGGWSPGVGRDESGYQSTSPHYSGNGDGGQGTISDVQDLISENITPDTVLSDEDKVWKLATEAYESNPGYALSFEGKKYSAELEAAGYEKGTQEYQDKMIQAFGMPNIVATGARTWGDEIYTGKRTDEFGQELGGDYIYSGLGQALMDQYDQPGSYEDKSEKYWTETRPEQDLLAERGDTDYGYGYGYDPGSYTVSGGYGYGYGYGGDPNQMGKTPFDYGDPYSEARFAPLEQHERMVDVNTPRYAARGGIMNLRR